MCYTHQNKKTFFEQCSREIPKSNLYIYLLGFVCHVYCIIFAFQQLSSISEIHTKLVTATSSTLVLLRSILGFPASFFFSVRPTLRFSLEMWGSKEEKKRVEIQTVLLCYYFGVKKQKVIGKTQNVFGLIYSFTHFNVAYAGGVSAMRKSPCGILLNSVSLGWQKLALAIVSTSLDSLQFTEFVSHYQPRFILL